MSLVSHAEAELKEMLAGDEMSQAMAENVLELIRVFAGQGHSGMSAGMASQLFALLADFKPLGPLTGADDEWNEVGLPSLDGRVLLQNRRCSRVFKGSDGPYDIDGRVFEDPEGHRFTSSDSIVMVTFPYVPKSVIVKVGADGKPLE